MITTDLSRPVRRNAGSLARAGFGNIFRQYAPETPVPVRELQVTGDYLERARKAREMLRSMLREMDLVQVMQTIEVRTNLTFFEALAMAKREECLIIPNDFFDIIFRMQSHRVGTRVRAVYDFFMFTGTLAVYEASGNAFRDKVVFTSKQNETFHTITFTVPDQFIGKKNCALIIDYPDFDFSETGDSRYELKVLDGGKIHLINNFPREIDWYSHTKHGIPTGNKWVGFDKPFLSGLVSSVDSFIGPAKRGYIYDPTTGRTVNLDETLEIRYGSGSFNVVVFPLSGKHRGK